MDDAAQARERLRRGMFPDPTTLRPETTMNATLTEAAPATATDLHALAKAWIQHADDAEVLTRHMESLRVQLGACRRLQEEAAAALGVAAFADLEADAGESRAVAGGTGVVVVRVTGDAGEPFACEFVPSAK